jgi:hypothetical protein
MKIIGLLLSVALVGALIYVMYGKKETADTAGLAPSATLGAPPPTDVARNAESAKDYTKSQICLADCASDERTCRGTAFDAPSVEACEATKAACESRCR